MSLQTRRYHLIGHTRQIRGLSSMIRLAILDTVEALGAISVAELAEVLGKPADSLYYHLRILERLGLIEKRGLRSTAGRAQTIYDVVGRPTALRYDPHQPRNVEAVSKVVSTTLRWAMRQFRKAFRPGIVVTGRRRELWGGGRIGRLSQKDLEEVNRLISDIAAIFERRNRSSDGKLYTYAHVLSPVINTRTL